MSGDVVEIACSPIPPVPTGTDEGMNGANTLEMNLIAWTNWMRAADLSPQTVELRLWQIRHVAVKMARSGTALMSADLEHLVTFLASEPWKPNTRRAYRASLRAFFAWLQLAGQRVDNPAALLPPVKVPRAVPRPAPEEAMAVALSIAAPDVALMVQLAGICGLRRGEIARVRLEDLIHDVVGDDALVVTGKGGHERIVPITAEMAIDIRLRGTNGWLFPSPRREGKPLTAGAVGKMVAAVLPDHWACHSLRHRCGTVAYQSLRDIRAVQELLGHAKIDTTTIYTKVPTDSLRALIAATSMPPAA
jgi:site-specific recombinase XerD